MFILLTHSKNSCYLFGVVDEQGVLKKNEVYISLPRITGVLEGKVLVSRCVFLSQTVCNTVVIIILI